MKAKTGKPQILNQEMILKTRMEANLIFIKQLRKDLLMNADLP